MPFKTEYNRFFLFQSVERDIYLMKNVEKRRIFSTLLAAIKFFVFCILRAHQLLVGGCMYL